MGGQSWRAKILLINIHYSSILLPKRALNRVLRAMLVPSRMLYAYKRKFLQCETTRTVKRSITGVATNNYSMNLNYLAMRRGTGPRFCIVFLQLIISGSCYVLDSDNLPIQMLRAVLDNSPLKVSLRPAGY